MKILIYADSPTVNTGFGVVSRNIIQQLLDKIPEATIDVLGINEDGQHHPMRHDQRVRIYSAITQVDIYGRMKLLDMIARNSYDHVFCVHDLPKFLEPIDKSGATVCSAIGKLKELIGTKYHLYFPIDVHIPVGLNHDWLQPIKAFDSLIPYTYFAKQQMENAGIKTLDPMYHGVDTKQFYPMSRQQRKQARKELFNVEDKRPIISVIARNQWRKNIPDSIEVFAELKNIQKDALLYLHTKMVDFGGDLRPYLNMWGLVEGKDYMHAGMLDTQRGVSVDRLNAIYNATDVLLSCASGEGFGLPYIEALATKTAVCTLDVSVEEELLPIEYVFQDNYSDFYANYYVSSGQDGYPFPRYKVNHKRALAHRIDDILKEDLSEIKNTCYNEIKERFDWSREVDKLVNLFKK